MKKILFPLVAMASSFSAVAEERYSMEDLTALHKAQSWNELLYHANDIRPSKRDDAWQGLVQMLQQELSIVTFLPEPLIALLV